MGKLVLQGNIRLQKKAPVIYESYNDPGTS